MVSRLHFQNGIIGVRHQVSSLEHTRDLPFVSPHAIRYKDLNHVQHGIRGQHKGPNAAPTVSCPWGHNSQQGTFGTPPRSSHLLGVQQRSVQHTSKGTLTYPNMLNGTTAPQREELLAQPQPTSPHERHGQHTSMRRIICPPSWPVRLDCHVGHVQGLGN